MLNFIFRNPALALYKAIIFDDHITKEDSSKARTSRLHILRTPYRLSTL